MRKTNHLILKFLSIFLFIISHSSSYAMDSSNFHQSVGEKRKEFSEEIFNEPPLINKIKQDHAFFKNNYIITQPELINTPDSSNNTPLHWISHHSQGNLMHALVLNLIQSGANIHLKNTDGNTPLHLAAAQGHLNMIQTLIQQGATFDIKNNKGETPLLLATFHGQTAIISAFMTECFKEIQRYHQHESSLFHAAATYGHLEIVQAFLQADIPWNVTNQEGNTPLHFAANNGHHNVIQMLLEKGAHLLIKNNKGETPLFFATSHGQTEIITAFMTECLQEIQSHKGTSLFHAAAAHGHLKIVQAFIEAGAPLEITNKNGDTPLHFATYHGHLDIAQTLIKNGAHLDIKNNDGRSPLLLATLQGKIQIITAFMIPCLAEINANLNKEPSLLHLAAAHGDLAMVQAFIQAGAPLTIVNHHGDTPLHFATARGHMDVTHALISAGAPIHAKNKQGHTPLLLATLKGHTQIITSLMEHCIHEIQTHRGQAPSLFHAAAENGHLEIIQAFIQAQIPLEVPSKQGSTPLHFAAAHGHTQIVLALMHANANLNLQNSEGLSPLALAIHFGQTKLINTFIAQCCIEIQSHDGKEPSLFHIAAAKGHLEIAQTFIRENVNLEVKDKNQHTPLHFAAIHGNTDMVRALILAGAVLEAKTTHGHTPLCLAVMNGHKETVSILLKSGADPSTLSESSATPLHYAIVQGFPEIAEMLLNYDTKTLRHQLSQQLMDPNQMTRYPAESNALDIAHLSPHANQFKRLIAISEALLAFQQQNSEGLIAHVEAGKEIDHQLLENDLLQTPFHRDSLQAFAKQLKMQLDSSRVKSENSNKIISSIFHSINNRLTGSLKNLCLRKLQLCFTNSGKYFTHPYAQDNGITQENSFKNIDMEEKTANYFSQNSDNPTLENNLNLIFKTEPRSADKLFVTDPKTFLIKAMEKDLHAPKP